MLPTGTDNPRKRKAHDLGKILEESKQLVVRNEPMFLIYRDPATLEQSSRLLAQKSQRHYDSTARIKANNLLSKKKFDAEKLERKIESLEVRSNAEQEQIIFETDLDAYINYQHEMILGGAIKESNKETIEQYERDTMTSINNEWSLCKRELIEELAQTRYTAEGVPREDRMYDTPQRTPGYASTSTFRGVTPFTPLTPAMTPSRSVRSAITQKMIEYANVVIALVDAKIKNISLPMISKFSEILGYPDEVQAELGEVWDILKTIIGESNTVRGKKSENEYKEWQNNPDALKNQLLFGSISFLERQYSQYIERRLQEKPNVARLGGNPTQIAKVDAFIRVLRDVNRRNESPDYETWMKIYYLFRIGALNEALEVAHREAKIIPPAFINFLQAYTSQQSQRG